jgi:hypothetical protein
MIDLAMRRNKAHSVCYGVLGSRINLFAGFQVAEPAFKSRVVERQNGEVAESPVGAECLVWTTGQAAITPDTLTTQDWMWLKSDVVHRTFVDTPLALIAASRVRFGLGQQKA